MHKSAKGKKIFLVGAGGHVRSLINTLELIGLKVEGIYDYNFKHSEMISGYRVIGGLKDIRSDDILVLSFVGDIAKREKLYKKYYKQICRENIANPSATIEKRSKVGQSNQILSGVYINANVKIGNCNVLNSRSILEHEVVIGDHNHIAVGAIICGRVTIGNRCFIGAGAVVIDKVQICDDSIIGANSVVINDIDEPGTYVGNPARKVK